MPSWKGVSPAEPIFPSVYISSLLYGCEFWDLYRLHLLNPERICVSCIEIISRLHWWDTLPPRWNSELFKVNDNLNHVCQLFSLAISSAWLLWWIGALAKNKQLRNRVMAILNTSNLFSSPLKKKGVAHVQTVWRRIRIDTVHAKARLIHQEERLEVVALKILQDFGWPTYGKESWSCVILISYTRSCLA